MSSPLLLNGKGTDSCEPSPEAIWTPGSRSIWGCGEKISGGGGTGGDVGVGMEFAAVGVETRDVGESDARDDIDQPCDWG